MISNIVAGFIVLGIQLYFIDRMIKNNAHRREQKLWTPFRIVFLQGICDYYDALMLCTNNFITDIENELEEIKSRKRLDLSSIDRLKKIVKKSKEALQSNKHDFYFTLQTVSPSLQPYAGEYCNEVMYFDYTLTKYLNEAEKMILGFDEKKFRDDNYTSHFLNGIWAKGSALKMIRDMRLIHFKESFTNSVWKKEGLHYFKGDFLVEEDYAGALQTERSIEELARIPRTLPIKNFFETDEEYQERVKKTGQNRVGRGGQA